MDQSDLKSPFEKGVHPEGIHPEGDLGGFSKETEGRERRELCRSGCPKV